jgi:glycosyltransferase involved in cell wall biosynthesis
MPIYLERVRGRRQQTGVLIFVGRICEPKGVLDLIDAFALARLPRATSLWFVGDGPAVDAVVQRGSQLGIATRIHLPGFTKDVLPMLRIADALILPSHSEGIPRVLMEACAAGVPTVATDLPGIRELIRHEHNGLLVPPSQPQALARALERLYAEPNLIEEIVANARKTIDQRYTAARQALDYQRKYWVLARGAA